jgi:AraC-like DNA-binding protein
LEVRTAQRCGCESTRLTQRAIQVAPPRAATFARRLPQGHLLGSRAFIQEHLGDPELRPAEIAAAYHISLRLLHKLFQEQGTTVAGWIRTRRLLKLSVDADALQI